MLRPLYSGPLYSVLVLLSLLLNGAPVCGQGPAYTRPAKAKNNDPDFAMQGEYVGTIQVDDEIRLGSQVVAMGNGRFRARTHFGGLPGEGWNGEMLPPVDAERKADGAVTFHSDQGYGVLKDGKMTIFVDGAAVGELKKVNRKSPTLGKKPPEGAIVLFDGKNTDQWEHGEMDRKLLTFAARTKDKHGVTSKQRFGSHTLHIEFRLPYMPEARGQQRGNSGLYLQGRYEVQMLDSFGLDGQDNDCGGIYKIARPKVNMCYPPLRWQTYDVDFAAAEYDDAGKRTKHPRITVKHNGVLIHKDLELPHATTAAPLKAGPENGPVFMQDHSNPVRYRNIWVLPKF